MNTIEAVQEMLVEQFDLQPAQLHPESRLSDLGVDSLATIEFLFLLEERFTLELSETTVRIATVGDIATEIDRLLAIKTVGVAA